MNLIRVIQGGVSLMLGMNKGLRNERIEQACKLCVMSHVNGKYTAWCVKGCKCYMPSKTSIQNEVCPEQVWANDWVNKDRLDELNKKNNFKIT